MPHGCPPQLNGPTTGQQQEHLQNKTTQLQWAPATLRNRMDPMIDRQAMANDLQQARQARIEAEAANCEVEELIWQVQHVQLGRQRIVFSIAGFDQEPAGPGN